MSLHQIARPAADGSTSAPTLVLLHGLGADEHDLASIASELDPRLRVVSLRAPYETGYGGFSWFDIQFHPDGSRTMDESQAVESRDRVISEVRRLSGSGKLLLGGFSQGAMIAAGVLLHEPEFVDAAWLMSGRLLPVFQTPSRAQVTRPVLVQHGSFDDLISVQEGRNLASALSTAGHGVRFEEYPIGHGIEYQGLSDAAAWMEPLLMR